MSAALQLAPQGTPERDAQDRAFLDHMAESHGLKSFECPECGGIGHCRKCGGEGVLYTVPSRTSCGAGCIAPARFALVGRLGVS